VDQQRLDLRVHAGRYCICRLGPDEPTPAWTALVSFCSLTRTGEELSIVCNQEAVPPDVRAERNWRLLGVQGPLDLSMIGVLAGLTTTLATAGVSIFAISTFDTDYLLLRDDDLHRALEALREAGYAVPLTAL
jgi:uncharacterized protein